MVRFIFMLMIIISIVSCSQTPVIEQPATQETETNIVQRTANLTPSNSIPPTEEPIVGTPVAGAVQTMQTAEKKMLDTLQAIRTLQGDQVLDCQENRQESFQKLQDFFGPNCFKFDRNSFWFQDQTGKKIGISETDGGLTRCKMGYFTSYKRLISYQAIGNVLIEVEFYVDATKGELMVHRYRNGVRNSAENYILKSLNH